jgi:hypothetical protein
MLVNLYAEVLIAWNYYDFNKAVSIVVSSVPTNLRQYYADQLMLMHTEVAFGL